MGTAEQASTAGLLWFRHDLRMHDNPALARIASLCDSLTCVFIIDPDWFSVNAYGLKSMGAHRYNFLMQSLASLDQQLRAYNQQIQICFGSPRACIADLLDTHHYQLIALNTHCGEYERDDEQWLRTQCQGQQVIATQGATLFCEETLPFAVNDMPQVYTPFRKRVEKEATVSKQCNTPASLPPILRAETTSPVSSVAAQGQFIGGEAAGIEHMDGYFASDSPASYKDTRNALDSWADSTKFSPWLANGCLSPRRIFSEVERYEKEVTKNDSTYWIKFELLWREYFHWLSRCHGHRLFRFSGIKDDAPSTPHSQEVFATWCWGETGYPIVDACMRQLNRTGYMSNRGRQLVASCLAHELQQDWRYGAAYFEQQLIDFDVASNWGNWLYLAGVGTDPRGHRQFNLEKQAEQYDPDGVFRAKWLD